MTAGAAPAASSAVLPTVYRATFMALSKLISSNLTVNKMRAALTVLAVALSVSLVVSVTGGYASAEAAASKMLDRIMGSADATLSRKGDPHADIPQAVVDELRKDPAVTRVTGRLESESPLAHADGQPLHDRPATIIGIDRPIDDRVENLTFNSGKWFETADGNFAVIDQVAAQKLGMKVGGEFSLPGPDGAMKLKVVGIVQKPTILASGIQSVYVPLHTLQKFARPGKPPSVSRVMIDLKPASRTTQGLDAFVVRWKDKLADQDLSLRMSRDNHKQLNDNLQVVRLLSYLGGAVAMLAATFIVFSALSMGVAERSRTLAMLRAVGATRGQVAWIVVVEGLTLAGVGVLVGVPLGFAWTALLAWKFSHVFIAGVKLSKGGLLLGAGGSLLAAAVASVMPAWSASRVDPLEALAPQAKPASRWLPLGCFLAGVPLALVDTAVIYVPWARVFSHAKDPDVLAKQIKLVGHLVVGLPALFVGFFLMAPLTVLVISRLFGPLVATVLRIRPAVLRQQLGSGLWRVAGTCAALMVGLAVLVGMEVQGNSALQGWRLPDKFPDIFVVSWLTGLNDQQIDKLEHIKGIKPGDLLPIAIASPEFGGGSIFALSSAAAMPDATMFFGIDPAKGMRMMQLEFRQGNAADAIKQLNQGRHIIVTDEFYQLKHLGVGDKLALKTPRHGTVDYTIAAVVWSPGIDVIVSMFDMSRQFSQRTAASIFGSMHDAKEDFGVDGIHLFAANLDYFTDKDQVLKDVRRELGLLGLMAGDVRQIKKGMQTALGDLLLLITVVPFAALAVASLGVANTILAGLRTRRWQFGILRSIGLTGSQLIRLVLAEAALIGVAGVVLGLGTGSVLAFNARELSRSIVGNDPPVAIPWGVLAAGVVAVILVSILAGLWPAIRAAKTPPLALLQSGRAGV